MNLHDYFMLCMKKKMYMDRRWILRCFNIMPFDSESDVPYIPVFKDKACFFRDENGNETQITDYKYRELMYDLTAAVDVEPDEFEYFSEKTTTSYGNMTIGMCIYEWALGGKLPFFNGKDHWSDKELDKQVYDAIKDGTITVDYEYKRYIQALDHCSVFADFVLPTGDEAMFLADPDVKRLANELMEKHKDELHKPQVAAMVEAKVTSADKEKMKKTPGYGFLGTSGKLVGTVRKKLCYFQGITPDPLDPSKVTFIKSSLKEGWDVDTFPDMVNNVTSGSFSRGALTALGGVITKQIMRYAGNIKITSEDCGTKLGIRFKTEKFNAKVLEGRYDAKTGKIITKAEVGKEYIIRDPMTCQESGGNLCAKCLGKRVAESGRAIDSQLVSFSGGVLKSFLSAFHSKDIKLEQFSFSSRLR